MLDSLRALTCTPIRSENHFLNLRRCSDCVPYLVLKTSVSGGLRTSSGFQKQHSVEISAYFKDGDEQRAISYQTLVDAWLNAAGCVDLGACGCFCVQGSPGSRITPSSDGMLRVNFTFSGRYRQAQSDSSSVSASVSASV